MQNITVKSDAPAVNDSELSAITVEYIGNMSEPAVPLILEGWVSRITTHHQLGKNRLRTV